MPQIWRWLVLAVSLVVWVGCCNIGQADLAGGAAFLGQFMFWAMLLFGLVVMYAPPLFQEGVGGFLVILLSINSGALIHAATNTSDGFTTFTMYWVIGFCAPLWWLFATMLYVVVGVVLAVSPLIAAGIFWDTTRPSPEARPISSKAAPKAVGDPGGLLIS